jgi:Mpv17 / PMP22 family
MRLCHITNVSSIAGLLWIWIPVSSAFSHPITLYGRPSTSLGASSVVDVIDGFFQSQPYVSAFLTCSIKASAADFFSQQRSIGLSQATESCHGHLNQVITHADVTASTEHHQGSLAAVSSSVDIPRNLAFLCYGGVYQGLCENFMYSTLFPAWFGDFPALQKVALQVATDVALIGPFLCLPTAYVVMSIFTRHDDTENLPLLAAARNTLSAALTKYKEDVVHRNLLRNYWALWIPVQSLTFGVVPPHYRVAFVAMISFAWVYNLSSVASSANDVSISIDSNRSSAV